MALVGSSGFLEDTVKGLLNVDVFVEQPLVAQMRHRATFGQAVHRLLGLQISSGTSLALLARDRLFHSQVRTPAARGRLEVALDLLLEPAILRVVRLLLGRSEGRR